MDTFLSEKPLSSTGTFPSAPKVEEYFRNLYAATPPPPTPATEDAKLQPLSAATTIFGKIVSAEVEEAKANLSPSAPGPNGLGINQLKAADTKLISTLLSCIFLGNLQLPRNTTARMTLIHKNGARDDPVNWRPITVSSTLVRLLHRILVRRISNAMETSTDQRGFKRMDGTLATGLLLHTYLASRKSQKKQWCR